MTVSSQQAALLLLAEREKPATASALLESHDSDAVGALASTIGQLSFGTTDSLEQQLEDARTRIEARHAEGITLTTVLDDDYPQNLRTVYDRPLLLWIRGRLLDRDARSIAVVGARAASDEGLRRARKLAGHLVEAGYVVVSGLAAGIDRAAHGGALESGGRTIAVIGTGVNKAYPVENAELQGRLAAETAVISQFDPDAGARKWSFPMRNRVMSGLSRATVVVEASRTSGARMQARIALEHGRPVVLLRSLLEQHEWAREFATRPGVSVLDRDGLEPLLSHLDQLYGNELVSAA